MDIIKGEGVIALFNTYFEFTHNIVQHRWSFLIAKSQNFCYNNIKIKGKLMRKIQYFYKFTIVFLFTIIILTGCTSLSEKIVFSKSSGEWARALRELDKTGSEERLYITRNLFELFLQKSQGDIYKIKAAFGLMRIARINVKEGGYETALNICSYICLNSNIGKLPDGYEDVFIKKIGKRYGNTLAIVLPASVKDRRKDEWNSLQNLIMFIKNRYIISTNKIQANFIR